MKTHGARRSVEEIATAMVVVDGGFGKLQIPEPPNDLTDQQAAIWRGVVNSEPIELFASEATRAMLRDYCEHRCEASKISLVLNEFKSEWLKNDEGVRRYSTLLKMRDLELRAVTMLATKLRITNQARYIPARVARQAEKFPQVKPWDV